MGKAESHPIISAGTKSNQEVQISTKNPKIMKKTQKVNKTTKIMKKIQR